MLNMFNNFKPIANLFIFLYFLSDLNIAYFDFLFLLSFCWYQRLLTCNVSIFETKLFDSIKDMIIFDLYFI